MLVRSAIGGSSGKSTQMRSAEVPEAGQLFFLLCVILLISTSIMVSQAVLEVLCSAVISAAEQRLFNLRYEFSISFLHLHSV